MSDHPGDPAKKPEECKRKPGFAYPERRCPHMKETGGGFEGEQYECAVCGEDYYLDYEEMR